MTDSREFLKRTKRLQQKRRHVHRQSRIAKSYGIKSEFYTIQTGSFYNHRYHKRKALNCGDPKCPMCGNPRKFFNIPTIQERRFSYDNDDSY